MGKLCCIKALLPDTFRKYSFENYEYLSTWNTGMTWNAEINIDTSISQNLITYSATGIIRNDFVTRKLLAIRSCQIKLTSGQQEEVVLSQIKKDDNVGKRYKILKWLRLSVRTFVSEKQGAIKIINFQLFLGDFLTKNYDMKFGV